MLHITYTLRSVIKIKIKIENDLHGVYKKKSNLLSVNVCNLVFEKGN